MPSGPISRLISERSTRHIGSAWKSKKQHETQTRYILEKLQNCPKKRDQFDLVQDDPAQAALASAAFAALSEHAPGWISREVMVETVWVLERAYRLPRDRIADAIDGLLSARELVVEEADRIGLAAQRWREGGAGFADQMIALAGQGAGCHETLTFDRKAAKIPGMRQLAAR